MILHRVKFSVDQSVIFVDELSAIGWSIKKIVLTTGAQMVITAVQPLAFKKFTKAYSTSLPIDLILKDFVRAVLESEAPRR